MRSWVMQPGTLVTHWENVRYSALTVVGMTALTTAWMAMLYTTAAETLGEYYQNKDVLTRRLLTLFFSSFSQAEIWAARQYQNVRSGLIKIRKLQLSGA